MKEFDLFGIVGEGSFPSHVSSSETFREACNNGSRVQVDTDLPIRIFHHQRATTPFTTDGLRYHRATRAFRDPLYPALLIKEPIVVGKPSVKGNSWKWSVARDPGTGRPVLVHQSGDRWVSPYEGDIGQIWCEHHPIRELAMGPPVTV